MKLEKLTPEQEAMLPIYKDKWLNKIFNYELFNKNTEEHIQTKMKEMYAFCTLSEPKVIVVDSPMACQTILLELKKEHGIKDEAFTDFSGYINYSDFGWMSFYDFFKNETDIELDDKLLAVISFVEASFMQIQLEGFCIVSRYPSFISRNANNDLHNLEEGAIAFADGYKQHYINGRFLEEDIFNKVLEEKYTFEDFMAESNEETKSTVLAFIQEKFGDEKLYRFLAKNLTEIDTYVDSKEEQYLVGTSGGMNIGVYTLFKGEINEEEIAYVRCYCPTTDRMFFLGVEPTNTNAKDAIASLYTVPRILAGQIKAIARQGKFCPFL